MRDINGADFRFAKTLTLPFFGSGIVDLPPGGVKRVKNSRKMQMVFFVFYGRVMVDLGSPMQNFSIGKGGMWQVPRGKSVRFLYSSRHLSVRYVYALSLTCRFCLLPHLISELRNNPPTPPHHPLRLPTRPLFFSTKLQN